MTQPDPKTTLRARILAELRALDPTEAADSSRRLCEHLLTLDAVRSAQHVLGFAPLGTEPDIGALLDSLRRDGKTVLLPRLGAEKGSLEAIPLTGPLEELDRDSMGVRVPSDGTPLPPEEIQLVLVPGIAFDRWGQRLGRGGGYYDRLLSRIAHAQLVGVCFERSMCDDVPVEPHDRRVDRVITECRMIDCADDIQPPK